MDNETWKQLIDKVWESIPNRLNNRDEDSEFRAGINHALFTLEMEMKNRLILQVDPFSTKPGICKKLSDKEIELLEV